MRGRGATLRGRELTPPAAVAKVDLEELRRRVQRSAAEGWPGARIARLAPLAGGGSSLTYLAWLEGVPDDSRRLVVKVAPPGIAPVRNRDVLRQARILRALGCRGAPPVPVVCFEDPGEPPALSPFFGMAFVAGECVEPILSAPAKLPAAAEVSARARSAARGLAALHAVEPDAIPGDDEAVVTLADELARWHRALATVDESLRPDADALYASLGARIPAPVLPTLLHGDWRLGNMLCAAGSIRAVIDWELWAVGDPRIDLAWFLNYADPDGQPPLSHAAPGMPPPAALRAEYERARGPVRDLAWFSALVRYKQAATIALIVKHNRRRPSPAPQLETFAPTPGLVLRRGLALLRD